MVTTKACQHVIEHPEFNVTAVLDSHLYFMHAFVQCAACDTHYVLTAVDLTPQHCAYRVDWIDSGIAQQTARSLGQGSCDINRANTELASAMAFTEPLNFALLRTNGVLQPLVPIPEGVMLPRCSWRELPCDGDIIKQLIA